MRAVRAWWLLGTMIVTGCGGGSSPAGPSPQPPPAPTTALVSGHVTATNGGQALGGVSVAFGATTVTSDGAGAFSSSLPFGSVRVALSGTGILPRSLTAAVNGARDLPLDAIALGGGFDPTFYRQFVRNTFDAPGGVEPLRRQPRSPRVYLRTVDDAGGAIDSGTLDTIEHAVRTTAELWSGGRLSVLAVERGTDTRAGVAGWVTVTWPNPVLPDKCGVADVGLDGGVIRLNYLRPTCSCPGTKMYPRAVRHELGHAFGFWHTDSNDDVMFGGTSPTCDALPSAREQYHAAIAYSRPVGNTDPDADPASAVLALPHRVIY
jgi:hypothetical protein